MQTNQEISKIFYEIADILEMQNIQWKPQAYRQAAQSIDSLKEDVAEIYKKGSIKALEAIPNIGKALAKKILEYIKIKKIKEHQRLLKAIPKHMRELMKIHGLGPKKIKKLHDILKISTISQLKEAINEHKISKLEGFGEKSEQDIKEAIELAKSSKERIPLAEAEKQGNEIISQLKSTELENISLAGSIKRKKPFVKDLDILASSGNPERIISAFISLPQIKKVLAKGPTKASVMLKSGINADLRVVKPESWGAALLYFTGNKNFNIKIRKIAIKRGYKLNEYGLFSGNKQIAGKTEEEIAKVLKIKFPKPEEREV